MSADTATSAEMPPPLTAEEYRAFIGQIELRNLWMSFGSARNLLGPLTPEAVHLEVGDHANYELVDGGFVCTHAYRVVATIDGREAFELECELSVHFDSTSTMSNQIFSVFAEANLPLNTWPYLREFVTSSAGRMGWQAITLPALKRGVRPPPASGEASQSAVSGQAPTPKRKRRKSSSSLPDTDGV